MENVRTNIDIARTVRAWCAAHEHRWEAQRIASRFRYVVREGVEKAIVALRTMTHEANLVVLGIGTVEFTALDSGTKREAVSRTGRYASEFDLQRFLDGCVAEFEGMARAAR